MDLRSGVLDTCEDYARTKRGFIEYKFFPHPDTKTEDRRIITCCGINSAINSQICELGTVELTGVDSKYIKIKSRDDESFSTIIDSKLSDLLDKIDDNIEAVIQIED